MISVRLRLHVLPTSQIFVTLTNFLHEPLFILNVFNFGNPVNWVFNCSARTMKVSLKVNNLTTIEFLTCNSYQVICQTTHDHKYF